MLALGRVANRARNKKAFLGFERAQAYLHRKFRSVLAQSEQIQPRAYRPRLWVYEKSLPMEGTSVAKSFRHQHINAFPNQIFPFPAKKIFRLRVHHRDF